MSFLAIDVGNTRMKWAIFNRAGAGADILVQGVEFLENIDRLADGAWAGIPAPQCMLGCVVSGDAVRRRVELQIRECWDIPPRWVVPGASEAGVINGYDHPARLGADRWVAMIGARQRLLAQGQRRPLLIVMAGTAVTADALDAQGRFLGGIIMPGYGIMLRSVESGTAGLHVPTGEVEPFPSNTSDALASGAVYALSGGIERMLHNLTQHAGEPPVCIMTGGAGWKIRPFFLHPFDLVETLLFDGLLEIAAHRNKTVQG